MLHLVRRFPGRCLLLFVDNSPAAAWLIRGHAPHADSSAAVEAMHRTLVLASSSLWVEYVPTRLNIADEPSRDRSAVAVTVLREAGFSTFARPSFSLAPAWDLARAAI